MRSVSVADLADLVSGEVVGDGTQLVSGAATLRDAVAGEITFAENDVLIDKLAETAAAAAVVPIGTGPISLPSIEVESVVDAFVNVVCHFRPSRPPQRPGVSPQAFVDPSANIAGDVDVFPGAFVGADVEIGSGSTIHSGARVLAGCRIGCDTQVFPNVVLYENCQVGDRVLLHAGAAIGAYGFGYNSESGRHQLSAQLGYVVIEDDVEIGALSSVDRGTYGATRIGEGSKIDNQVMIAHNCRIGKHNLICSQVGIAGSSTTGDYVVMAGQVGIRDHMDIGSKVTIGAQAGVMNHIPDGSTYLGSPAVPEREQMVMFAATAKLPTMRREFRKLQKRVEQLEQGQPTSGQEDPSRSSSEAA